MAVSSTKGQSARDTGSEKTTSKPAVRIVTGGDSRESIVKWDSDGVVLQFDAKEDFVVLDDVTVAALHADNKLRYTHARDFHAAWQDTQASDAARELHVDLQLTSKPTDKLKATARNGMRTRWVRPELVRDREAKGWSVADGRTKSFLGAKNGIHRIGYNGQDELILMERSEAECKRDELAKAEANNKLAGAVPRVVTGAAAQAGFREYDEGRDTKARNWKELETAGNAGEE